MIQANTVVLQRSIKPCDTENVVLLLKQIKGTQETLGMFYLFKCFPKDCSFLQNFVFNAFFD